MQAPEQITAKSLADHLEVLTKSVFQAGISWKVIEAKWDGFREAFLGFDPEKVADLTPKDVDRLAADERIIRNRRKIEATIHNAETLLALDRDHGGFERFLRSFASYDDLAEDLKKRFKFLGEMGIYHWLYVVKHPVPGYEEWSRSRGVAVAKGAGRRKRAGTR